MAGGQTLDTLTDLFSATSKATLTPKTWLINEAQFRTTLLRLIMRSHDMSEQIQGGSAIQDYVYFDEISTYSDYQPLEEFDLQLAQHLTRWEVPWRFSQVHVVFNKQEKGLQNVEQLNRGARAMVFKDIINAKWVNVMTSLNNGFERGFFAQPNSAQMESTSGKVPYSVFCTIHEHGATLSDFAPTATVPPGFTTIQQINPVTQPKWRNPVQSYANGVQTQAQARWDGFTAFLKMYTRLEFEDLVYSPEYGEASSLESPEGFIFCSLRGKALIEANLGTKSDFLRSSAADPSISRAPGGGLMYNGIPIKYVQKMDTAAVWDDGASGFAAEFNASTDENGNALGNPDFEGPRFVFIAPKYYKKIVHATHFLEEEKPPPSQTQPFDRVVYFDNWHNNVCRSRQRAGGVVKPSASITLTGTGV